MEKKEELFVTRDLYLAATLISLRFKMSAIDYQAEGSRSQMVGYFSFPQTPSLEDAVRDYWLEKLAVEPRSFQNCVRSLKSQVSTEYKRPV